jgi:hypothetical protein
MTDFWRGDAETGDKSQWCKQTVQSDDRIQVTQNVVSQGLYSYRVELRPGDSPSGCRATLASGPTSRLGTCHQIVDGDEAFYGLSVYLPSDTFTKQDKWRLVIQFKAHNTGSPPVSLNVRADNWLFNYRPTASSSVLHKEKFPVNKDSWEKFVLHAKWSSDPKIGFLELWRNGNIVVPKFFTSNIHIKNGQKVPNFVAIGLYRDSGIKVTDVIYHDGFVAAPTFEEAAQ